MGVVRKLSLTLLIMVPLMTANPLPDYSNEEEEEFLSDLPPPHNFSEDDGHPPSQECDLPDISRRRRAVFSAKETLETAEQVLYTPFIHHRQVAQIQPHGEQHTSASSPEYVFRGTPFGAVFVKHQLDAIPHHKQQ